MPTVVLLDVSLSMLRHVSMPDCNEEYNLKHLAIHGLNTLLDHMVQNYKLEFISLVVFSSSWKVLVPFTRDFDNFKAQLTKIEECDKTCIDLALEAVKSIVLEEWGIGTPIQVILVTDGSVGVGKHSLNHFIQTLGKPDRLEDGPFLPFPFPSKLHIMCLDQKSNSSVIGLYEKLIELNGGEGQVFTPEGPLSLKSVQSMFTKLMETYYSPFRGILRCGNLTSHIQLLPSPETYIKSRDFEIIKRTISKEIAVCGFLDMNDVSSPASFSRHLVLPVPPKGDSNEGIKTESESGDEGDGTIEDGKTPSFCVLLHGSLKVESMVALCHLGDDWYGMLYSWADSKKKSNLMLSVFEPGLDVISWLGNLTFLLPATEFKNSPYGEDDNNSPFPVKPSEKRSYAQSSVVWIRQSGLQADIQKILRHARKLPEKTQNFYKELNRLRKAALSFGFYELLDGLASILDRECALLPGSTHPDAALQLSHAANALRNIGHQFRDLNANILPLRTKFSEGDT